MAQFRLLKPKSGLAFICLCLLFVCYFTTRLMGEMMCISFSQQHVPGVRNMGEWRLGAQQYSIYECNNCKCLIFTVNEPIYHLQTMRVCFVSRCFHFFILRFSGTNGISRSAKQVMRARTSSKVALCTPNWPVHDPSLRQAQPSAFMRQW